MALIALSGKKGSGKDLTGKIINILLNSPQLNNKGVLNFLEKDIITDKSYYYNKWEIKKFADKLKDIVCLLIGCNREQLENEEFKSTPLLEEWWYWKLEREGGYSTILLPYSQSTGTENFELVKMTPRLMLTLLGTECGRQIIHPQIWVNSLMAEYKGINKKFDAIIKGYSYCIPEGHGEYSGKFIDCKEFEYEVFPNWIITDMRFPNEMKAVEDRDGICIRVNRPKQEWIQVGDYENFTGKKVLEVEEHSSETALDNADFQYTIDNNGTIDELIDKVRRILQAEFVEMKFYNN